MYKIETKKTLAENIILMDVYAPRIAKSALPGQFVIVRTNETSERIPLTICDYDAEKGTITIVTQMVGMSTKVICAKNVGDSFADVAGPLGMPSEFTHLNSDDFHAKKILFIAGGVGAAPVYPQVKWLHNRGVKADVIIGAKTKEMLIFENEMREVADNLYIATDDGSYGFKGLVTNLIEDLIEKQGKVYDEVVAIGPMIMMKFIAIATKKHNIKTTASLNSIMVDGTGMCGACRVSVGGKTKFTCVDGPEFDAHLVDFDEALRRQKLYRDKENEAECKCLEKISNN